ncbi:MAG: response regulator, partial [Chloroflexota bacterium]
MISVLIVEDDFRVAEIHRAYVERLPGFKVVAEAHSAAEALRIAEESRPDLVLLDIYLPDRSGLEVLRALHAPGRHHVDVIAITADKDVDTLREALQGGVIHYLVKPFQFSAFREKLESYVAMRERLAQVHELDQGEVDRIYSLLRSEPSSSLPKGVSPTTLALVVRALRSATEDVSAVDIARATGISRVTSRRYLEHLARSGVVAISMRYGSAGRPEHRYRWA